MKERYTIGEVAALLNISPQTLRFYDKTKTVIPSYTDQSTGYRYYTYDQIHYIDRVKYLQKFGFRLEDIRDALATNDTGKFRRFLARQRQSIDGEIARLEDLRDDLDWYLRYYSYVDYDHCNNVPYKEEEPERFLLAEAFAPGEALYGTAGYRLTKLQHSEPFAQARFLRQNGYLLDFQALLEGRMVPTHYYVCLREAPGFSHPNLMRIPGGTFFCTQARILLEPFDSFFVQKYFQGTQGPRLVLANEYEDNFTDFQHCIYEIQIQESTHRRRAPSAGDL